MSISIFAMLFIGAGMVSTIEPVYLTLVSIHKPLGITILVLALARLGACATACRRCRPSAGAVEAGGEALACGADTF